MIEWPQQRPTLPGWVPLCAQRYLAHTEAGYSIRNLARTAGVHASTVLRQVRRIETRRDDPLVDTALSELAHYFPADSIARRVGERKKDFTPMTGPTTGSDMPTDDLPNGATLDREAGRISRQLCEAGAVLAVAEKMEKAVVVQGWGR